MNISPHIKPVPTVSEPEPTVDSRMGAILAFVCAFLMICLGWHFGPAVWGFLSMLWSAA
jgi:hypothetical protein